MTRLSARQLQQLARRKLARLGYGGNFIDTAVPLVVLGYRLGAKAAQRKRARK